MSRDDAIHASIAASSEGCQRSPTWIPLPVGGGPRFFFGTTRVLAINHGTIETSRGGAASPMVLERSHATTFCWLGNIFRLFQISVYDPGDRFGSISVRRGCASRRRRGRYWSALLAYLSLLARAPITPTPARRFDPAHDGHETLVNRPQADHPPMQRQSLRPKRILMLLARGRGDRAREGTLEPAGSRGRAAATKKCPSRCLDGWEVPKEGLTCSSSDVRG